MSSDQAQVRTYGGWRRARGMGLFGLGPMQTFTVLAAITALIVSGSLGLRAVAVTAGPCALLVALLVLRWDGVPLSAGITQRLRWLVGTSRGYNSYCSGVMVTGEHAWQLPGVLAPTALLTVADESGGGYAVVYNRRLGTMTVTLRCAATSTWLADPDASAAWVANWGGWLANLGYLPIVDHVAVTVDTAPDPGSRLADHVSRRIVPHGPASARRVLQRLVEVSPAAAADVETRVSVTFKPGASPSKPKNLDEALDEISRTLPGLQDSLGSCGLTVLDRASADTISAVVRTAFDPAARGDVARLAATPGLDLGRWVDWDSAGPVMAEEHLDRYVHDSGTSVSWAWHEAPRQHVHADVLARLLAPGPYPKRVSLLYRPFLAGEAARIVESEVNAAAFRAAYHRAQKRDESARDHADRERALQTAREEATGSGVGLMSLFVTTTVVSAENLGRAVADVESRADVAKIRLRRLHASQAAGFATTLPCGVCPPQLARQWPH
ncbi:SCO6880 family protein [Micromonospora aurantiaca]|uniref:SCO6880 family protein n=1 Tax=Micromonospora aurantiaca (nom. illeg.) TaxID=47850 RepID=UPI002E17D3C0